MQTRYKSTFQKIWVFLETDHSSDCIFQIAYRFEIFRKPGKWQQLNLTRCKTAKNIWLNKLCPDSTAITLMSYYCKHYVIPLLHLSLHAMNVKETHCFPPYLPTDPFRCPYTNGCPSPEKKAKRRRSRLGNTTTSCFVWGLWIAFFYSKRQCQITFVIWWIEYVLFDVVMHISHIDCTFVT